VDISVGSTGALPPCSGGGGRPALRVKSPADSSQRQTHRVRDLPSPGPDGDESRTIREEPRHGEAAHAAPEAARGVLGRLPGRRGDNARKVLLPSLPLPLPLPLSLLLCRPSSASYYGHGIVALVAVDADLLPSSSLPTENLILMKLTLPRQDYPCS